MKVPGFPLGCACWGPAGEGGGPVCPVTLPQVQTWSSSPQGAHSSAEWVWPQEGLGAFGWGAVGQEGGSEQVGKSRLAPRYSKCEAASP